MGKGSTQRPTNRVAFDRNWDAIFTKKEINVLSLFDGMSCGRVALERAGVKVGKYFASEIDKYAIKVAQKNYPDTIQLGDVCDIQYPETFDGHKIDLIIGGSPCQGFSRAGLGLNFDDPRSKLFFEFARLIKECKPKYFLLENVRMKQEHQDVITEILGVEPIAINSNLVSAQNRHRIYWTNIPNDGQPADRGIMLKDILEDDPENYVIMSQRFTDRNKDAGCLIDKSKMKASNLSAMEYVKNGRQGDYLACDQSGTPKEPDGVLLENGNQELSHNEMCQVGDAKEYSHYNHRATKAVYSAEGKAPTLLTMTGGNRQPKVAMYQTPRGKNKGGVTMRDKSPTISSSSWEHNNYVESNIREKSKCVRSGGRGSYDRHEWDSVDEKHWRKLTPIECERLQTLPDNYTDGVSNSQRYKMLGNGWTVEVISYLFKNIGETK
jgi:DNA (cytosine-5)-methyltransferase 3A